MTDSIFQAAKDRVSARDAAERYGVAVDRSGLALCPFHVEDTPSLKLYPGNRGFYCFGCHTGGTVVDFVSKLFSLDAMGAVRRLNEDFRLGLALDRRPTEEDRRAAHHRAELAATRQAFEAWRWETINKLNAAIRLANKARPSGWADLTEQQALAIHWRDALESYSDALTSGSMAERMEVFRDRKEVSEVCQTILNSMQQKSKAA